MSPEARKQAPERGRQAGKRYLLERPVRPGSRVWLAAGPDHAPAALKFGPLASIRREYRLLAALAHPHIVHATDCVEDGPQSFIVLEYLSGGDLVSLTGERPEFWLAALASVIGALGWLHGHGIVHRDLKARNVMFDAAGRARLIDFGSAAAIGDRWTVAGTTAAAVDPQRGAAAVGVADDVYALAALVHELLYGSPPGTRPAAAPAVPAACSDLAQLVARSLAAGAERPVLSHFASVIELLLGHQGEQTA